MEVPVCFVCLKRADTSSHWKYSDKSKSGDVTGGAENVSIYTKFLKFVSEYFNFGTQCSLLFLNDGGAAREPQVFCESCQSLISSVCGLYSKLLAAQLRLAWKLGELGELMECSKKKVSNKLWNELANSLSIQMSRCGAEVESSDVNELRNRLETKCLQQRGKHLPKVVIKRVSFPKLFKDRDGDEDGQEVNATKSSVLWIVQEQDTQTETAAGSGISSYSSLCSMSKEEDLVKMEVESMFGEEDHIICGEMLDEENTCIAESLLVPTSKRLKKQPGSRFPNQNFNKGTHSDSEYSDDDENDDKRDSDYEIDSKMEVASWKSDTEPESEPGAMSGKKRKFLHRSSKSRQSESRSGNLAGTIEDDKTEVSAPETPKPRKKIVFVEDKIEKTCNHCGRIFYSRYELKEHLKVLEKDKSLEQKFQCCFCWRTFAYLQSQEMHMSTQHKNLIKTTTPFLCTEVLCGKGFSSHLEHNAHLKEHSKSESIHQCPKCGLGFISPTHLELHQLIHTKPIGITSHNRGRAHCPSSSCSLKFGKVEQLQEHFNKYHGSRLKFECSKCGVDCLSHSSLTIHFISKKCETENTRKKPKPCYRCLVCEKEFQSSKTLEEHLKMHEKQSSTKSFSCYFCSFSCSLEYTFKKHLRMTMRHKKINEASFPCDDLSCKLSFRTVEELNKHLKTHSEITFPCSKCGWAFLHENRLKLHEILHLKWTNERFHCPFPGCTYSDRTLRKIQDHFNIRHGDKLKLHSCTHPNCDVACTTYPALVIHMKCHSEKDDPKRPIKCPDCGKHCGNEHRLNWHRTWYHVSIPCPQCDLTFRTGMLLNEHLKMKHNLPILPPVKPLKVSRKTLTKKEIKLKKLHRHVRSSKNESVSRVKRKYERREPIPVNHCDICGRPWRSLLKLQQHRETHLSPEEREEQQSRICDVCGATFRNETRLKVHIFRKHKIKKRLPAIMCHECGRWFSSDNKLKRHKAAFHSGKERNCHTCQICNRTMTTKLTLKKHMANIHRWNDANGKGPMPKKITCKFPSCSFNCDSEPELHSHIQDDHNQAASSAMATLFMCTLCGRVFANQQRLQRHGVVHSGEKAFKCEICGGGYAQKSSLKDHMEAIHGEGREEESISCGMPNCNATFKSKTYLYNHRRAMHNVRIRGKSSN